MNITMTWAQELKKRKKGWETLTCGLESKTWPTLEALIISLQTQDI